MRPHACSSDPFRPYIMRGSRHPFLPRPFAPAAPSSPPRPLPELQQGATPPPKRRRLATAPGPRVRRAPGTRLLQHTGVQVLNSSTSKRHAYNGKGDTLCGAWTCGTPEEPAPHAVFFSNEDGAAFTSSEAKPCQRCLNSRLQGLLGVDGNAYPLFQSSPMGSRTPLQPPEPAIELSFILLGLLFPSSSSS